MPREIAIQIYKMACGLAMNMGVEPRVVQGGNGTLEIQLRMLVEGCDLVATHLHSNLSAQFRLRFEVHIIPSKYLIYWLRYHGLGASNSLTYSPSFSRNELPTNQGYCYQYSSSWLCKPSYSS